MYWLSCSIEYERYGGEEYLVQVSLSVYASIGFTANKRQLLRAEWRVIDSNERTMHAQPHWHAIYRDPSTNRDYFGREAEVMEFSSERDTRVEVGESGVVPSTMEHFHYAMASQWHMPGDNAHQVPLNEPCVASWLGGSLRYIVAQLGYIAKREGDEVQG
jgi:hypothetical protein